LIITEYKMWGDQGPHQRNRGGSRELTRGIKHVITVYKMWGDQGPHQRNRGDSRGYIRIQDKRPHQRTRDVRIQGATSEYQGLHQGRSHITGLRATPGPGPHRRTRAIAG
jgi:hypothetical protein